MTDAPASPDVVSQPTGWFGDHRLARIFKNAGLLLGGRVTTGLINLAVLVIAARALGAEQFGLVVLVQTYVQTVQAIATFQSWQAVIRYGAVALEQKDMRSFHSLLRFCTLLDVGGVVIGTLIAVLAVPWIGPMLDWDGKVMAAAVPYCFVLLLMVTATPTGLLRLFNRFDLLSIQSVVSPALRLVGVMIAAALDAPLWAYLLVWFVGGGLAGLVLIVMGWREAARQGYLKGFTLSPMSALEALAHHPGLWRFAVVSNLHATIQVVSQQMTTVLVGGLASPAAAGLFKVARDVATAITKPAEMLNTAIYPEFARLASQEQWQPMPRLIIRTGAVAAAAGFALVVLAAFIGPWFLATAFGPEFVEAHATLMWLLTAAVIGIAGFSMDPALYAMGRPGIPLQVNTVAVILFVPLLIVLTNWIGPLGAGIASFVSAAGIFGAMVVFTTVHLRQRLH
jgi:O-antigen/teichoic acid export membrane protein